MIAQEIFDDMIRRIKEKIKKDTVITFDPSTGIQRKYLNGRLIAVKHVRTFLKPDGG